MTGQLTISKEEQLPVPQENEIIYDPSRYVERSGKTIKLREIAEKSKQSVLLVEERDMGRYGKGLFAKYSVLNKILFLPYTGLYDSDLNDSDINEKYQEFKDSSYINSVGNIICLTNTNLCLAHSAQFLLATNEKSNAAVTANLTAALIYFKIRFDNKIISLPIQYLTNTTSLSSGMQLGWNYGPEYWIKLKSGFVEWDPQGNIIDKTAIVPVVINGKIKNLFLSQNKENKFFPYDTKDVAVRIALTRKKIDPDISYLIILPQDVKKSLFGSDNLYNEAPIILCKNNLIITIQGADFIALPIERYSPIQKVPVNTNYKVHNGKLCLRVDFLESLTAYELEKLFIRLKIPEVLIKNFYKENIIFSNNKISDKLRDLFEILDLIRVEVSSKNFSENTTVSCITFKPHQSTLPRPDTLSSEENFNTLRT